MNWFAEVMICDARQCPARVRGYYQRGKLILGFCQHHFFEYQPALVSRKWKVAAKDGILVRQREK